MRSSARSWVLVLIAAVLVCLVPAAAAGAAETPEIEKFFAANCKVSAKDCGHIVGPEEPFFKEGHYSITSEPELAEAKNEGFTQAGGRVPYGVTDFTMKTEGELPFAKPTETVKHIRTDVAPGLATNPEALPKCSTEEYGKELKGSGLFFAPECSEETEVGEQQATVYVPEAGIDLALEGPVFNLVQPTGRSSLFGVALKLPKELTKKKLEEAFAAEGHPLGKPTEEFLEAQQYYAHTLIEGNVEWGKESKGTGVGDYHDYFEIDVSPELPLISSRLVFFGRGTSGKAEFITNPTACPGHLTTTLRTTDLEGAIVSRPYTPPAGIEVTGCNEVPFNPGFALTQGSTAPDSPDELTTEVTLPHNPETNDDSQVKAATITLPEGMTLNESAAAGLEACTPAQARIHSETFGTDCPAGSQIATVGLEVPGLPAGSLTGAVYLGGPESGPITGPPYTMYIVANSARYGVSVRLKAEVIPNETTGQLTTIVNEPPEQPFSKLTLHFDRHNLTAIANPLECGGGATGSASFEPYSAPGTHKELGFGPSVTGCSSPIPFSLSQTTENEPSAGGGHASYTLNLGRAPGNQFLSKVTTTLPSGLVGAIPAVTLCGEPQASQGTCPASSRIGTARVTAGTGPSPFGFAGPVYMTGPYNGAPFGLSIAIRAVAGPFDLGTVVTRSTINVDRSTARVTAVSLVPRIVKGIPVRLRSLSVEVNKQGFLFNPTNCSPEATETTLESQGGAIQTGLNSPFLLENCAALAFNPSFTAKTSAKTSRLNGASLETTLKLPEGGSNIKSVLVTLPKQLPSRLTTLQKACTEAAFAANPFSCPAASQVGTVTAVTPTLPGTMTGPAYLVSHGGAAFPDLDLILDGSGVRIILVGNTNIKNGITTTNFATSPDAPVSSLTVKLPTGPKSALAGFGDLCRNPLNMPTTFTGQNGKVVKKNVRINVTGCGVKIVGKKVIRGIAYITVKTFGAGRITGSGSGVSRRSRTFGKAVSTALLKLPLSSKVRHRHRVKIKVTFKSKQKGVHSSSTRATVRF